MKRLVLILLIIITLIIASCGPAEKDCEKPFINSNGECCLDLDDNGICDEKQVKEPLAENETIKGAPEQVIVEEKQKPEENKTSSTPTAAVIAEQEEETTPAPKTETEDTDEVNKTTKPTTVEEYLAKLESQGSAEPETKMEELLFTFAQKVSGYKYAFEANWFLVRGDKIKIILQSAVPISGVKIDSKYYPLFYYDTVYLDRQEKIGQAYCEGADPRIGKRQCFNLKIEDIPLRVNYEQYSKKLPEDWLFEYLSKTPDDIGENKYYVNGRRTTKVVFNEANKTTTLFFDETIGLPVKVEIRRAGKLAEIYSYVELSAGTVRAEDVIHRTAADIPPTEVFYSTR